MIFFKKSRNKKLAPQTIEAADHCISNDAIPRHAITVVKTLQQAGFKAYLVGGCVRDLILGSTPKDFDVATEATPQQIKKLFRNCRLIGRRFILAHVYFGKDIIEVATFRGNPTTDVKGPTSKSIERKANNVFGHIEEDAFRRDFTINALYYDPVEGVVLDYVKGFPDTQARLLRLIGDPKTRYQEDPVRLLRALRFCSKLGARLAPETEQPLYTFGAKLSLVAPARLLDETLKLFLHGYAQAILPLLKQYGLHAYLFPGCDQYSPAQWALIDAGLAATDRRIARHDPCSPAFILALLFWGSYQSQLQRLKKSNDRHGRREEAMAASLAPLIPLFSLPKQLQAQIRGIWTLQTYLVNARPHQVERLLSHPDFRAAVDFLALRAEYEHPQLAKWSAWWQANS